jgi:hypothetical protein
MTRAAYFVALESGRASVARVEGDAVHLETAEPDSEDASTEDLAEAIREQLAKLGYAGEGVCLGLSSRRVLAAPVDCENLPRRQRTSALAFRLEACLPLDAEDLAVGFLPSVGGRALGVAAEAAPLVELLERLSRRGVETASICPTALLALSEVAAGREDGDFVVCASPEHVDVFRLADGRPITWHTAAPEAGEPVRAMEVDLLARPAAADALQVTLVGPEADRLGAAMAERMDASVATREETVMELAARGARRLLEGTGAGWVDLRQGPLAPSDAWGRLARPIRTAAALAVLVLAAACGGAWWRAGRYDALASRFEARQAAVYHERHPNAAVPVNPRSRLASEARRAEGVSGAEGVLPEAPCGLEALRQIVAGLPNDLRFRIYDLRIAPNDVQLDGQARSHGDAEKLARALEEKAGCRMAPPRTEADAKGSVTFVLAGKPGEEAPARGQTEVEP